jgi:hypothetical protein
VPHGDDLDEPAYRTEGELTDAVIKRVQSGLASLRQGREDVGYSATQIEQLERTTLTEAGQVAAAGVKAVRDAAAGGN